jgi:DnaJ-domain-containing protein 1
VEWLAAWLLGTVTQQDGMFDRSKDNNGGPTEVQIALSDGRTLSGKLTLPPGRSLPDFLNGAATFVEFQPVDGDRMFIAKSSVHSVRPSPSMPAAPDLWAGPTEGSGFDPFKVLGISADSSRDDAREAYLKLAKSYHPDRYASADLPREVLEYLAVMVRRINAAYDTVQAQMKKKAAKQEPIFTKAGNG